MLSSSVHEGLQSQYYRRGPRCMYRKERRDPYSAPATGSVMQLQGDRSTLRQTTTLGQRSRSRKSPALGGQARASALTALGSPTHLWTPGHLPASTLLIERTPTCLLDFVGKDGRSNACIYLLSLLKPTNETLTGLKKKKSHKGHKNRREDNSNKIGSWGVNYER